MIVLDTILDVLDTDDVRLHVPALTHLLSLVQSADSTVISSLISKISDFERIYNKLASNCTVDDYTDDSLMEKITNELTKKRTSINTRNGHDIVNGNIQKGNSNEYSSEKLLVHGQNSPRDHNTNRSDDIQNAKIEPGVSSDQKDGLGIGAVDGSYIFSSKFLADIISYVYIYIDPQRSFVYRSLGSVIPLKCFGHLYVRILFGHLISPNALFLSKDSSFIYNLIYYGSLLLVDLNCLFDFVDFLLDFNLGDLIFIFVDEFCYLKVVDYLFRLSYFMDTRRYLLSVCLHFGDYVSFLRYFLCFHSRSRPIGILELEKDIECSPEGNADKTINAGLDTKRDNGDHVANLPKDNGLSGSNSACSKSEISLGKTGSSSFDSFLSEIPSVSDKDSFADGLIASFRSGLLTPQQLAALIKTLRHPDKNSLITDKNKSCNDPGHNGSKIEENGKNVDNDNNSETVPDTKDVNVREKHSNFGLDTNSIKSVSFFGGPLKFLGLNDRFVILNSSFLRSVPFSFVRDLNSFAFKQSLISTRPPNVFFVPDFEDVCLSVAVDFCFLNCSFSEFLQIIFILSDTQSMMIDEQYLKRIIALREFRDTSVSDTTHSIEKHLNPSIISEKQHQSKSQTDPNPDINIRSRGNRSTLGYPQLDGDVNVLLRALNGTLSPLFLSYLYSDLQVIDPIPVETFAKATNRLERDLETKRFGPYAVCNGFVHTGFGRDAVFFDGLSYNLTLEHILGCSKIDQLAILGSLGLILRQADNDKDTDKRPNSNDSSIQKCNDPCSEGENDPNTVSSPVSEVVDSSEVRKLLEDSLWTPEVSYKRMGALLCYALSSCYYGSSKDYQLQKQQLLEDRQGEEKGLKDALQKIHQRLTIAQSSSVQDMKCIKVKHINTSPSIIDNTGLPKIVHTEEIKNTAASRINDSRSHETISSNTKIHNDTNFSCNDNLMSLKNTSVDFNDLFDEAGGLANFVELTRTLQVNDALRRYTPFESLAVEDDHAHVLLAVLSETLAHASCKFLANCGVLAAYCMYIDTQCSLPKEILLPMLYRESIEVSGFSCMALGSIYAGTADQELMNYFLAIYTERCESDGESVFFLLIIIGAAFLFIHRSDLFEGANFNDNSFYESYIENFGSYKCIFKAFAYLGSAREDVLEEMFEELYIHEQPKENISKILSEKYVKEKFTNETKNIHKHPRERAIMNARRVTFDETQSTEDINSSPKDSTGQIVFDSDNTNIEITECIEQCDNISCIHNDHFSHYDHPDNPFDINIQSTSNLYSHIDTKHAPKLHQITHKNHFKSDLSSNICVLKPFEIFVDAVPKEMIRSSETQKIQKPKKICIDCHSIRQRTYINTLEDSDDEISFQPEIQLCGPHEKTTKNTRVRDKSHSLHNFCHLRNHSNSNTPSNNNNNNTDNNNNHSNNVNSSNASNISNASNNTTQTNQSITTLISPINKEDNFEEPQSVETHSKAMLLLSITLLAMNNPETKETWKKSLINLSQKDTTNIIPMLLAILNPSTNDTETIDCLSRTINTYEPATSIIALAITGSGTNNKRIQKIIEHQYQFHSKASKITHLGQIAQGILHLGKGTKEITINKQRGSTLFRKGIMSLTVITTLFMGNQTPLISKWNFLFYALVPAIQEKFIITTDKHLNFVTTNIRIGKESPNDNNEMTEINIQESPVIMQQREIAEIPGYTPKGIIENTIVVEETALQSR